MASMAGKVLGDFVTNRTTRINKRTYKPMTKKITDDNSAEASPITPLEPNTLPSIAADNPNRVKVDASPEAYKIDLLNAAFFASSFPSPDFEDSEPPRYATVKGSSDMEHGENAVKSPAPYKKAMLVGLAVASCDSTNCDTVSWASYKSTPISPENFNGKTLPECCFTVFVP